MRPNRRRKRHHRFCDNCEELLGKLTMKCPRCNRLVLTPLHKIAIGTLGILTLAAVLKAVDLI